MTYVRASTMKTNKTHVRSVNLDCEKLDRGAVCPESMQFFWKSLYGILQYFEYLTLFYHIWTMNYEISGCSFS